MTTPDIVSFHGEVDALVARLTTRHAERLACRRGCSSCCVDDITVFEVEARRIRERHATLLATGIPHPPGACAFVDGEGACRIYEERPYVCRTQGLPLRWMEDTEDGVVERRDICALNEPGPDIVALPPEACWTLGPAEAKLYAIQRQRGEADRVALRSLFARSSTSTEAPPKIDTGRRRVPFEE